MPEIIASHVVDLPRGGSRVAEGSTADCLAWISGRRGIERVALVLSAVPTDEGCDAAVCVPLSTFLAWEAEATAVTAAWENRWMLTEGMSARHREGARADLRRAVAAALVAAAVNGVDAQGTLDVGF